MPLEPGKSKAAFSHNVEAEEKAGKPQKQAVAIAYSEKRRTGDDEPAGPGYAPVKGSISSLAEMNAANQRYHGQLEGETQYPNTNDAETVAKVECPRCHGVGRIFSKTGNGSICPTCAGSGKVNAADKTGDAHEGFEKVERSVAQEPGVKDPKAVAAAIGMKKYGKAGMEAKAQEGRK